MKLAPKLSKIYTRRTNDKAACLAVFLMNVLPDVHICPLRKEGAVKYTNLTNSQRMPTEINEIGVRTKIKT